MKFFKTMPLILQDTNLSNFDKLVYFALVSFNGAKKCFPSISAIGERINSNSFKYISGSLKRLEDCHYIKITKRRRKTNVYDLTIEPDKKIIKTIAMKKEKTKVKTPKVKTPPVIVPETNESFIQGCNRDMIKETAGVIARANQREKPESADYSFVNAMIKLKAGDKYKDDSFDVTRKCLMILYLVNMYADKFKNELPFAWFRTVYANQIYKTVHSKIFEQPEGLRWL